MRYAMNIGAIGQGTLPTQEPDSTQQAATSQGAAKTGLKPHHHRHHKGSVPQAASQPTDTAQISEKAKDLAAQLSGKIATEETKESPAAKAAEQSLKADSNT